MAVPQLLPPLAGAWPISQGFGPSSISYAPYLGHPGIDWPVPEGTTIVATDTGVVERAGWLGDAGLSVTIRHPWGASLYAHLRYIAVTQGQQVSRGDGIAESGNTGRSTGPHLHFAIYPHGEPANNGYGGAVDPAPYLRFGPLPPPRPPRATDGNVVATAGCIESLLALMLATGLIVYGISRAR